MLWPPILGSWMRQSFCHMADISPPYPRGSTSRLSLSRGEMGGQCLQVLSAEKCSQGALFFKDDLKTPWPSKFVNQWEKQHATDSFLAGLLKALNSSPASCELLRAVRCLNANSTMGPSLSKHLPERVCCSRHSTSGKFCFWFCF